MIRNGDNVSHLVSGWTVRYKADHVYELGNLSLGAAKRVMSTVMTISPLAVGSSPRWWT